MEWARAGLLFALAGYLVGIVIRAGLLWGTERINPFVVGTNKRGLEWVLENAFPWLAILWVVEVVSAGIDGSWRVFPPAFERVLFSSEPLAYLGVVLAMIALAIFLRGLFDLGGSWRIGIDREQPGDFISDGIYRFTRNPIFVSMDLFLLATFLIVPSPVFLVFLLLFGLGIHLQILSEERFLRREYGEEYDAYCRRTPRYLGVSKSSSAEKVAS